MTRPCSEDPRERAVARYAAGEPIRTIGRDLAISPSCVSKWHKLKRDTGALTPGPVGGHKKRALSGETGTWLADRLRREPFTVRALVAELAARGVKTDARAVRVFVRAQVRCAPAVRGRGTGAGPASARDRPDRDHDRTSASSRH